MKNHIHKDIIEDSKDHKVRDEVPNVVTYKPQK